MYIFLKRVNIYDLYLYLHKLTLISFKMNKFNPKSFKKKGLKIVK